MPGALDQPANDSVSFSADLRRNFSIGRGRVKPGCAPGGTVLSSALNPGGLRLACAGPALRDRISTATSCGLIPSTNTNPSRSARLRTLLKPFGLQRGRGIEGRTGGSAREQAAETAARSAADDDRAAARPEQAQHFADGGGAIAGGHAAEQPGGIVDDHEIEGGLVGGQAGRRRGFDFHQHARLRGALPGARGRRVVGHEGDGAARQPDLLGDRRQPPAVGASNLRQPLAQPDAGHADDEHVRLVAASSTFRTD